MVPDRQHRFQSLTADFWGKLFFTSSEKRSTTGFQYSANASDLDKMGLLEQIQLDMGQVISAEPRKIYPRKGEQGTLFCRIENGGRASKGHCFAG